MQEPIPKDLISGEPIYLGTSDGLIYHAVEISPEAPVPAGWYTRDNLPEFPSKVSISRALIDAWIRREI